MRNLKKILALVLALVMSLSLMATASAASFPDVADDNAYKTAIDVLNGVKVFQGYNDGAEFRPTGEITRAEVAAIIYRISTGDVTDSQKDIYTAWNGAGKLSDVTTGWYAGYVNFCSNAGYIKGYPDGTFKASNKVTGYEVLAMILRAVGYGRNGEFSGSNWAITVGSLAQTLGITKNVKEDLGSPATRQMVAELLFRSIFTETQKYNALYMYEGTGTNLARENLSLEEVEGVVIANEYADLYDTDTLAAGKTMVREGDKTYTINYGTDLDDIGESRLIYIQNKTNVINLADSGKNVKSETTDNKSLSSVLSDANISKGDAESYVNFGQGTNWYSDWKIKYEISINTGIVAAKALIDGNGNLDDTHADYAAFDSDMQDALDDILALDRYANFVLPSEWDDSSYTLWYGAIDGDATNYLYNLTYTREFRIDAPIGAVHQTNIEEIFEIADKWNDNGYITGEVYVGTTSRKDISDEKSFNQFLEDYIREDDEATVSANERGNWLKVVDNNGDGKAEYIFKVIYTFAQVTRIRDDKVTLDVKNDNLLDGNDPCVDALNELTGEAVVSADELSEDDVVYYAIIDGKAQTYKAAMETATFDKINRNTRVVTTSDGTEWTESEVCEHIVDSNFQSGVTNLAGKVSYDCYFDRGGYLAAFVRSDLSNNFKLIVDGWFNQTKNGVEFAVKAYNDETGKIEVIDIGTNAGLFISGDVDDVLNNDWNALKFFGGVKERDGALDNHPAGALNGGDPTKESNKVKTTIASISEDGTILPVHSQYVTGRNYHDMIDMIGNKVPTNKSNSTFGKVYGTTNSSDTAYDSDVRDGDDNLMDNVEVIARADTVYYVVAGKTVVDVFTGYKNAPTGLDHVEDVYAVGTFRNSDNDKGRDYYYTADMVVIEVTDYDGDYEVVFVLDDETSHNDLSRRNLRVIGEDGKEKNVDIWNGNYRLATEDYGYVTNGVNGEKILPGVYKLYERSDDLYRLEKMTDEELSDARIVGGKSQYVSGTAPSDFVVLEAEYSDGSKNERSITLGEGALYHVRYNARNAAGYYDTEPDVDTSGDYRDILAAGVEGVRTSESGKNGHLDRDFWVTTDKNGLREGYSYFWNDVLIKYNKDNEIVWAISFANVYGSTEKVDYAQTIWANNLCAPEAVTELGISFTLGTDETVKVTYNGVEKTCTEENPTATFTVADGTNLFDVKIEASKGVNLAAVVAPTGWQLVGTPAADADSLRFAKVKSAALSLNRAAEEIATAEVYSVQGVVALIAEINEKADTGLTEAEKTAYTEILNAIKDNFITSDAASSAELSTSKLAEVIGTVANAEESVDLTEAKAAATKTVTEYKAAEIDKLGNEDNATLAKALETAKAAIEAAKTQEAIDAAVAAYKEAVDAKLTPAGGDELTGEALATAQSAATKAVTDYETEKKVSEMTGEAKTAADKAKTDATAAIAAAKTQAALDKAVADYKAAIDALVDDGSGDEQLPAEGPAAVEGVTAGNKSTDVSSFNTADGLKDYSLEAAKAALGNAENVTAVASYEMTVAETVFADGNEVVIPFVTSADQAPVVKGTLSEGVTAKAEKAGAPTPAVEGGDAEAEKVTWNITVTKANGTAKVGEAEGLKFTIVVVEAAAKDDEQKPGETDKVTITLAGEAKITKVTTSADRETNLIKDGETSVEVSKETVLEVTVEAGEGATVKVESGTDNKTVVENAAGEITDGTCVITLPKAAADETYTITVTENTNTNTDGE